MKKIYSYLIILFSMTAVMAQNFPADGIGYQAMLSESSKVTYGTTLTNLPVANKDIQVRFELIQNGGVILTDEHMLTTDVNGIFSCIIGTGDVSPAGQRLSDINWGADSVLVRVNIDQGEGFELFSEQKLWSTAYAQFANISRYASSDNDTSATNELQYLNMIGDSIKLTKVSGGISIKPLNDAIAKNTSDIASEKTRAENSEQSLQNQITILDNKLNAKGDELATAKDSISANRKTIDNNVNQISKNQSDITSNNNAIGANTTNITNNTNDISTNKSNISTNAGDINKLNDTAMVHRSEISKNTGAINTNASDISQNKTNISTNATDISELNDTAKVHRTEISKNTGAINTNASNISQNKTDISTNATDISKLNDTVKVHRTEISKNTGAINTNASNISQNKTDISTNATDISKLNDTVKVHRTEISNNTSATKKNAADLAKHITDDKDLDNTNELTDLNFNSTTKILSLSNPKTSTNRVSLSGIGADNMGNSTTNKQLTLNNVGSNYSFTASNSSRGVIRMHQKTGVGSIMEFIAQGTSAGNFPGHMEFFTQQSGYSAPVKNMTLWRDGTLTLHNGNLKVGTVTYPKAHNSTAGQVLTVDASGNATWKSQSSSSIALNNLTDAKTSGSGASKSIFIGSTPSAVGTYNLVLGMGNAGKITNARMNIILGNESATSLTTGLGNVSIGRYASRSLTTGNGNIHIGIGAGNAAMGNQHTGAESDNIYLGTERIPLGNNNVVIGRDVIARSYIYQLFSQTGNQVVLGNRLTTKYMTNKSWSVYSDRRIKKNIQEDVHGLDFVMQLRPVTYNYRMIPEGQSIPQEYIEANKKSNEEPEITKLKFSGFIAQEVQEAADKIGYDFSGVQKPESDEFMYSMSYSEFVVPLVKATQEQQKIIEKQDVLLKNQQKAIENLMLRIQALESK